ncbi:MAG: CPBP family intramembrane metalloprotease [Thermoguttaceae bacterium]|nr:CPBP family intramembrane metalloprotease [Thermoguttaceae bacterium]MDW8079664.1 CPBP family intramembrane glutamic endopeptidase [Thermoguttaceae bacterium]
MSENHDSRRLDARHAQRAFLLGVALEGGLVLVGIVLAQLFSLPHPIAAMTLTSTAVVWGILGAIPPLALLALFFRIPLRFLREIISIIETFFVPLLRHWSLGQIALLSALAGFGEEVFFRGVMQHVLQGPGDAAVDRWLGIIGAGILFGLFHAVSPGYLLFATAMGIYLGGLYFFTGNLLTAVIAHGVYDFLACLYLLRRSR